MAAVAVHRDIMKMFYGSPPMGANLPKPIVPKRQAPFEDFVLARNNFGGWLHVWKMEPLPERRYNQGDIYRFGRAHKRKFVEVVKKELESIGNIKVSFRLRQEFTREVESDEFPVKELDYIETKTQTVKHYFERDQPTIIMRRESEERIKQKFENFIQMVKDETDNRSEAGSGWVGGKDLAYIEVARYNPLRGGTYLPLPASLAKKKAIINVKNNDNECLKWAIRAALFPVQHGNHAQRTNKYPVNDGIDYTGIEFPMPIKQIDRLEAQNGFLAFNVSGWEKNNVVVYRISKKEKRIPRITGVRGNAALNCCIKRVSTLLFDQTKNSNAKHYCMFCITGFTSAEVLKNHQKRCNGVNGRPTRIEMPEEGKNKIFFQNFHKKMKMPYVIYADFEAILHKIKGFDRPPESKSYTVKIEKHETCGYAYKVVKSDGEVVGSGVYRGKNSVSNFLENILREEEEIRKNLAIPKPIKMTPADWERFRTASDCHM